MTTLDRAFIKAFSDSPSPAPRTRTTRPGRKLSAREAARQAMAEPTILPARADLASSLMAPLASFTSDAPRDLLEPQFEVARLAWPEACELLLAESSPQWDELIAHIMAQQAQGHKCLAIASCARSEGRTTLALSLAKRLSREGLRCLLFDADLDSPAIARRCRVAVSAGWCETLRKERPLSEAMIAALEDGVTLIPGRAGGQRPASEEMSRLADSFCLLREQFDLLLLDTHPLASDAAVDEFAKLAEATHVDAAYVVRDVRLTTPVELARLVASLTRMHVRAAGILENFAPAVADQATESTSDAPSIAATIDLAPVEHDILGHDIVEHGAVEAAPEREAFAPYVPIGPAAILGPATTLGPVAAGPGNRIDAPHEPQAHVPTASAESILAVNLENPVAGN